MRREVGRAVLVGDYEPHSPAWHTARDGGIGGSDVAAILGLSPWQSRFSLWHRKAGLAGDQQDTPAMSWGRRLEPVIADKWAEDRPRLTVSRAGTYRSKERPWQLANPDRLIAIGRGKPRYVLEVKTAHGFDNHAWGRAGTDEIPVYYRVQVIWYCDVFGFDTCHLAVLIGGSDYREFTVAYDPAEARLMRDAAEAFLDSVRSGDRPPIDDADATYQTVRRLHPGIEDIEKEVPDQIAVDYMAACDAERSARDWKRRASSALLDAMGTARYATFDGERIAMRTAVRDNPPHLRPLLRTGDTAA